MLGVIKCMRPEIIYLTMTYAKVRPVLRPFYRALFPWMLSPRTVEIPASIGLIGSTF